jgi:hypothetical protein
MPSKLNGKTIVEETLIDISSTTSKTDDYGETFPFIEIIGIIDSDPKEFKIPGTPVTTVSEAVIHEFYLDHHAPGPVNLQSLEIDISWEVEVSGNEGGSGQIRWQWADASNEVLVFEDFTDNITVNKNDPAGEEFHRYARFKAPTVTLFPIKIRIIGSVNEVGVTMDTLFNSDSHFKHTVTIE